MKQQASTIIGISGINLANELFIALKNELKAAIVSWNQFDDACAIGRLPEWEVNWFKRGSDYTEYDNKTLEIAILDLKNNSSPDEYILFQSPFGRQHKQTGQHIDIWVHVDVPLDVSLCKYLLLALKESVITREEIIQDLEYYLANSRSIFFQDDLKNRADLVINGLWAIEMQVQAIKEFIPLFSGPKK